MAKWRDFGKNLEKPPCKVVPVVFSLKIMSLGKVNKNNKKSDKGRLSH